MLTNVGITVMNGDLKPMESDAELIYSGLCMRRCYVETGNPLLGSEDYAARGEKVKPMTVDQMKLVLKLRELEKAAIEGRISVTS